MYNHNYLQEKQLICNLTKEEQQNIQYNMNIQWWSEKMWMNYSFMKMAIYGVYLDEVYFNQ